MHSYIIPRLIETKQTDLMSYLKLINCNELKSDARRLGIKGYSRLRRKELEQLLIDHLEPIIKDYDVQKIIDNFTHNIIENPHSNKKPIIPTKQDIYDFASTLEVIYWDSKKGYYLEKITSTTGSINSWGTKENAWDHILKSEVKFLKNRGAKDVITTDDLFPKYYQFVLHEIGHYYLDFFMQEAMMSDSIRDYYEMQPDEEKKEIYKNYLIKLRHFWGENGVRIWTDYITKTMGWSYNTTSDKNPNYSEFFYRGEGCFKYSPGFEEHIKSFQDNWIYRHELIDDLVKYLISYHRYNPQNDFCMMIENKIDKLVDYGILTIYDSFDPW